MMITASKVLDSINNQFNIMKKYKFLLSHDNGNMIMSTHASSKLIAMELIQKAELCPESAFIGQVVNIEDVKRGDYVRMVKQKKTWIKDAYCRTNKAYELQGWDDISECKYMKKGKEVLIDFEF